LLAIGRVLIALIFVSSGVEKFMDLGATASAIGSKGQPYANVLAGLTATLEAGGGLLIIVGWQTACRRPARDLLRGRGLLLP
jgi:putative oxidoreductase